MFDKGARMKAADIFSLESLRFRSSAAEAAGTCQETSHSGAGSHVDVEHPGVNAKSVATPACPIPENLSVMCVRGVKSGFIGTTKR
mmetsp:Transcript_43295/g.101518  ORF Transcript_43295/g.101518 Transcript_43295/m.101518 type:complete len:86 (+) Transcript_43295:1519-1776(+)